MINAVVYSRTSTVKFTQIPHPKFDSKGFFGKDDGIFSLGLFGTAASIMMSALDKVVHFLSPNYAPVPEQDRQWVIVRVHSAGSTFQCFTPQSFIGMLTVLHTFFSQE